MSEIRTGLYRILNDRFNDSELRTLCFSIKIDYDDLSGNGKADKARELIAYLERRGSIRQLLDVGKQLRPDIGWEDVFQDYESTRATESVETKDIVAKVHNGNRKTKYTLLTERTVALYPSFVRKLAKRPLVLIFAILVLVWLIVTYLQFILSPQIESVFPAVPIAGNPMTILGKNFPRDPKALQVLFNGLEAQKFYFLEEDRIELEVPQDAISGPLTLVKLGLIPGFREQSARYLWLDIKSPESTILLIGEDISRNEKEANILFSLRNATDKTHVTVYDIVVSTLVFEEVGVLHSGGHRIDLGVAAIFDNYPQGVSSLKTTSTSLFGQDIIINLEPKESDSFTFRILKPDIAHNLHVLFSISALYHDDQGRRRISYSDRIYRIIVDDRQGFISAESLDWNVDTLTDLEKKYLFFIYPRR